jgi:hypothetical protein
MKSQVPSETFLKNECRFAVDTFHSKNLAKPLDEGLKEAKKSRAITDDTINTVE